MVGRRMAQRARTVVFLSGVALSAFFWFSQPPAPPPAASQGGGEVHDAWSQAKHRQQTGAPIPLDDLPHLSFEIDEISTLDMRPYHNEYWTAYIESERLPEARVPVYPKWDDPAEGSFYCPQEGRYTLTIRVPVPKVHDGSREMDPPTCYPYRGFGEFWGPFMDKVPVQRMVEMCGTPQQLNAWDAREYFEGNHPPDIFGSKDSEVFVGKVTCIAPDTPRDELHRRHQVKLLAQRVYGPNGSTVIPSEGVEALGYWQKDTVVGTRKGSLSYQPQPEHCPQTFNQGYYKTHQEWCTTQSTVPTFRWTPYHTTRGLWYLTPAEVHKCLQRPIRFFGDSIMHQSRRGLDCLARGYAGLEDYQYRPVMMEGSALDFTALFPPRDAQGHITDAEIDSLLQIDKVEDDDDDEDVLEIW